MVIVVDLSGVSPARRRMSPMGRGWVAARRGPVAGCRQWVADGSRMGRGRVAARRGCWGGGFGGFVVHPPLRYHVRLAASGREGVARGRAWVADGSRAVAAVSRWCRGCRAGVIFCQTGDSYQETGRMGGYVRIRVSRNWYQYSDVGGRPRVWDLMLERHLWYSAAVRRRTGRC